MSLQELKSALGSLSDFQKGQDDPSLFSSNFRLLMELRTSAILKERERIVKDFQRLIQIWEKEP